MPERKKRKRAAAFIVSAAILLTGIGTFVPVSVNAAGECVIDTSTTYQNIRGFGGINHPEWAGDLTASQRETAFGNGPDQLGFTILRVFVNPDKNQWSKAVPTAKYASENNVTVFASPWEPPSSLAENGNGKGKLHLPSKNYGAYATHLNDFGSYMKQNGVDLYSISVQNEPDYASEWTYWSTDEVMNFIADYGDKITSTKLMSAESFQFSPDGASWVSGGDGGKRFYKKIMGNAKAMANCDLFGTHFYGTTREWMDYPELESCGKELWMTEVYVPNSDNNSSDRFPEALAVAENIHNGMCVSNLSAYVWWYIRRQYGPMNENGSVSKRGAMMAQYSKWVRPGAVRIAATEFPEGKKYVAMDTKSGNYGQLQTMVSAYKQDDQITVVAINPTPSDKTQSFNISSGEKIAGIEAYHTTGTENFRSVSAPSYSDSSFSASLPAQSVTTFVISTGEAEPDPNGYLFHYTFEKSAEGFTGRGGASAEAVSTDHYEGSKALAVTGRESTWHGASHSLSSAFKPGETYSFSAVVKQSANASEPMHFSIEYKDASGETAYDKIASGIAPKGEWVQLANPSYTIPADASSVQFYFETDGDTGTACDFLVDEVIGAPKGTEIEGPKAEALPDKPKTNPKTGEFLLGDANADGSISAADLSFAKALFIAKETDKNKIKAADVNCNQKLEQDDIEWFVKYLTGQTAKYPEKVEPDEPDEPEYSAFNYDPAVKARECDGSYFNQPANHGQVITENYNGINGANKMYVYVPYGYDESKKYNVFYLMHGGGESEETCFNDNDINIDVMLDNMIAKGELEPMIVVTPTFNKAPDGAGDVWKEMRETIIPYVEGKYSTYAKSTSLEDLKASRFHRGYGGFSMGGGSTWRMFCNNLDICAYFMPLSGHSWDGAAGIQNAIDQGGYQKDDYYVFAATGTEDLAYNNMVPLMNELKNDTKRFTYTSDFSKGNLYFLEAQGKVHWWPQVRHYIYVGLPYFFHEGK